MGSLRALFLVSGAVIGMTSLAQAADLLPPPPPMEAAPMVSQEFSGWYLRGDVGVGVQTGNLSPSVTPNPLIGAPGDAFNSFYNPSLSASAFFDAGVGYQINNWLRFDVTGEYRGGGHFQALEQIGIPSQGYQNANFYRGDVSSIIGLVNGYVDIGTWYGITPFVGAGVGFANNRLSGLTDTGFTYPGTTIPGGFIGGPGSPTGGYFSDGSKTSFAWALMTGFDFNVTENLKLELGYRYLDYGKIKSGSSNCFNGTGAGGGFSVANCGGSGNYLQTKDLTSSDFRLGLRWMFADTPTYQPEPQPLVRKY
jgi:opacity protein-like surface antigen